MSPSAEGMKHCNTCDRDLPPSQFGRKTSSPDGLKSQCRDCIKAYNQANRERIRARERATYPERREKRLVHNRAYYQANKEKLRAARREKYAQNPEVHRERSRVYYRANAEARLNYQRQYEQSRPGARAARAATTKAERLGAEGTFTPEEWLALVEKYEGRCIGCGVDEVTVDHVVPLTQGGTNWISNIQPLCRHCNQTKSDKTIDYRIGYTPPADPPKRGQHRNAKALAVAQALGVEYDALVAAVRQQAGGTLRIYRP